MPRLAIPVNCAGFAGDLKPEKGESHGKEQDGQPLFAGGSRLRGADGAGTLEFLWNAERRDSGDCTEDRLYSTDPRSMA